MGDEPPCARRTLGPLDLRSEPNRAEPCPPVLPCLVSSRSPLFYSRVTRSFQAGNRTSPRKHRAGHTFPRDLICVVPSSSLACGSRASVAGVQLSVSPSPSAPHSSSRAGRAMLCPFAVELRKQDGVPRTSAGESFTLKDTPTPPTPFPSLRPLSSTST